MKKRLIIRIGLPILFLVSLHGFFLYFFVLVPISDHVNQDINQDLTFFSRSAYNICNINFDTLLLSGLSDDESAVVIKQALTLGRIEDFFKQENLTGLVYDFKDKEVILKTDIPVLQEKFLNSDFDQGGIHILEVMKTKYYVSSSNFEPWNWRIIILRNENNYSALIANTKNIYLLALGSLIVLLLLSIFFIYQSINIPVNKIIKKIKMQSKPTYKGIYVFEFLSNTIAHMMESIHQSSEKYRMLVENSNHLVWELDLYSRFTFVSQTLTAILGYLPDEFIGNSPFSFMEEIQREKAIKELQKKSEQQMALEGLIYKMVHKNGSLVILEINGVPVFNKKGDFLGYRGICRDITERVKAEEEKISAQKVAGEEAKHALIGRVAGKLAHDFNNILGIIMGNTELALLDCKDEEIKKSLKITFEQTLRGKNITKNLVVFAKDHGLKPEFFVIGEKIDLVVRLLQKDLEGIEVINDDRAKVPELFADPGMIEHAIVNLLQNSIHATSKTEKPEIIIKTYCHLNMIYLEISDNGCGIPHEYLNKIFEPSFTLKGVKDTTDSYETGIKGTGYGMPNVKKYIELHNGNISVESTLNFGTKFTICLPVITKRIENKNDIEVINFQSQYRKNILIVEDEQAISDVLARLLTSKPYRHKVDVVNNAETAMDMFKKNKYDLISLDYILEGNSNGMDVYTQIRKTNQIIPILFVSGNIEFLESIKDLKINDQNIDHLSKPFQNQSYINAINKSMGKNEIL